MAKYNIGDKVLIIDVGSIMFGENRFYNGMVTEVLSVDTDGDIFLEDIKGAGFLVYSSEFHAIEKVTDKSSEDRRMAAIEKRLTALSVKVTELQMEVLGALDLLENVSDEVEEEADVPLFTQKHTKKSANKCRKEAIEKAKEFVKETRYRIYKDRMTLPAYVVNEEKRTVVALIKDVFSDEIISRGIAKCDPNDVFNADIGKAIAFGRAYGLDTTDFEMAPQPENIAIDGQLITFPPEDEWHREVVYRVDGIRQREDNLIIVKAGEGVKDMLGQRAYLIDDELRDLVIISDTEAKY